MFLTSQAIEALKLDHKKLFKEIKVLKNLSYTLQERQEAFKRLIPDLFSHTKREEQVIYLFMRGSKNDQLLFFALEGIEEHKIVDHLANEMLAVNSATPEWSAKAKVLAELIELHLNEEEDEIFPCLKKELNDDTDTTLFQKYESLKTENLFPTQNPSLSGRSNSVHETQLPFNF